MYRDKISRLSTSRWRCSVRGSSYTSAESLQCRESPNQIKILCWHRRFTSETCPLLSTTYTGVPDFIRCFRGSNGDATVFMTPTVPFPPPPPWVTCRTDTPVRTAGPTSPPPLARTGSVHPERRVTLSVRCLSLCLTPNVTRTSLSLAPPPHPTTAHSTLNSSFHPRLLRNALLYRPSLVPSWGPSTSPRPPVSLPDCYSCTRTQSRAKNKYSCIGTDDAPLPESPSSLPSLRGRVRLTIVVASSSVRLHKSGWNPLLDHCTPHPTLPSLLVHQRSTDRTTDVAPLS